MRRVLIVTLIPILACGERAPDDRPAEEAAPAAMQPRVEIVQPAEGDTVTGSEVQVVLAAHGIRVAPAQGERVEGEGHHHLFVDRDPTPMADTIPKEGQGIYHLGTGAEEFTLQNVSPGEHRLIAVFAWGDHVPIPRVQADTVRFYVR